MLRTVIFTLALSLVLIPGASLATGIHNFSSSSVSDFQHDSDHQISFAWELHDLCQTHGTEELDFFFWKLKLVESQEENTRFVSVYKKSWHGDWTLKKKVQCKNCGSTNPVPEASGWAVFLLGLALCGLWYYRRHTDRFAGRS